MPPPGPVARPKSPGPGKGGRRGRLSRFAVKKSLGPIGFSTSPCKSPGAGSTLRPQGGSNLRERFFGTGAPCREIFRKNKVFFRNAKNSARALERVDFMGFLPSVQTKINVQKVPVSMLKSAKYNPRKDLKPGDPAYEKIRRSLHDFGYVDPIIWNEVTGNIVGGHQRFKVLKAEGTEEIAGVVVRIHRNDSSSTIVGRQLPMKAWQRSASS